jgi:DNA-binding winged helix-turn-helix (wHTH) protein/TolB-like protein/tetratricopeptide (TPR) repeat protein
MESSTERIPVLRFGAFTLDVENGELRRLGERVPLQDKPLQLLSLLVEKHGQLVTREEIRQELWGADTFLEFDDTLNHAVKKLRAALGDSADSPLFIKTLPRQGYRFLVPVEPGNVGGGNGSVTSTAVVPNGTKRRLLIGVSLVCLLAAGLVTAALFRPESTVPPASLLVLPFRSLDAGPEADRIGQGISEQVTAKLMTLQGLRLLSPEAAYRVSSAGTSPAEAGKRLNAEAVLVGSVRTAKERIRVNAQLIRTADGRILWAGGGLEVEASDMLDAERVLAVAIGKRLLGALSSRERTAMACTPTSNAEAFELFVRGKLAMRNSAREQDLRLAEQLLDRAVRIDSVFPEALAWLALAQARSFGRGFAGDEVRRASLGNARRALAIDPSVTVARLALITIFHTTGQAEEGLREAAILRKSGAADAVSLSAIATAYWRAGMPDRAVPIYQQAFQMDPEDPAIPHQLAFAAYWAGQYELGLRVLESDPTEAATLPRINLMLATGRRDVARSVAFQVIASPRISSLTAAYAPYILRAMGAGDLARREMRQRLPVYERQFAHVRNERSWIALGLIYSILKDKPRAREQARLALDINPGDPWALFHAGAIYAETGDDEQAIEYVRKAIARGFLALPYLDWPYWRLYQLRAHPELVALRQTLHSKIDALRQQY